MDDGHEVEGKRGPALDNVAHDFDGYAGRRTKQHDSALSAGQEHSAPVLLDSLTAERESREAAAASAREAVDAARAKRAQFAAEVASAFEEPRTRDKAAARLAAAETELRRREKVADAAAAAAAVALAAEIKHRDAHTGYTDGKAKEDAARDAAAMAEEAKATAARREAAREAERRARDAKDAADAGDGAAALGAAAAAAALAADDATGAPASPDAAAARRAARAGRSKTQLSDVVRARWQAHNALFGVFAAHPPESVSLSDVPFLDLKLLDMAASHAPDDVDVKALQARWHPDKFTQKFGARFAAAERESIMERVNEVSAALNALKVTNTAAAAAAAGA
jgi:hypothetical protein